MIVNSILLDLTKRYICGKISIEFVMWDNAQNIIRKVEFLNYIFKKKIMVNQETVNTPKKRAGFLVAFRAMFASDEEKIDSEVQAEVDKLEAESKNNIRAIEVGVFGKSKNQEREELSEKLKPEKIEPLKNANTKKVKEQEEREI